ncbi:MAG: aryl-sulfate sulfotransferase, partial [Edaphobacter sp.]
PMNGFAGSITVQIGPLPAGVTATPASLSLTPGTLQQILISASSTAAAGSGTISLTGTSSAITQNASAALTVSAAPPATTTASLSASSFDFGHNLVNNALTKTVAILTNTGSDPLTLNPLLSGDPSYSIATGTASCGLQLAAGASCDMLLTYNPTTPSSPAAQTTTLSMGFGDVPNGTPQTIAITGVSASLPTGQVTATNNPQVALYTMTLPYPGSVTINFGTTTSYGLQTWTQSTSTPGGTVSIYVAGMLASTAYHMQAAVKFVNGITANDADHTFTTQAIPANLQIQLTTATTPGMTPQPGLELINPLAGTPTGVIVTDLSGNTLWTYQDPGNTSLNFIDGVKMLPNGNLLMVIGPSSAVPIHGLASPAAITEIREVTLGGDTVNTVNLNNLNSELAAASCAECNVSLTNFHHDVDPLPNGHILIVANTTMALS